MMEGLRAPSTDQTVLSVPGADLFASHLESNLDLFRATRSHPFGDRASLGEVRDLCRHEIMGQLGSESQFKRSTGPLIVTGHQPEFCHPGVWAKNFLAFGLARSVGGRAFNLVADADACHQTLVGFPQWTGNPKRLRRDWLRLGRPVPGAPWQLAPGPDQAQEKAFHSRLIGLKETLSWTPLAAEICSLTSLSANGPHKAESNVVPLNLGQWSSRLRRMAQQSLGLDLPDLSQSELCPQEGFGWFAGEIISRSGEFMALHNQALEAFREQSGIKNPGQPVPPLESRGDWIEAPFWIWRSDSFDGRKRAWVRTSPLREISLGDPREGRMIPLHGIAPKEICRHLASHGLALRPRALTNTLFLRWFCCDWFVHGLGGAIYDRITDRLGEAYYGHPAPRYGMVTATLRLPFSVAAAIDEAQLAQKIRRYWWNPALWQSHDPDRAKLIAAYETTRRTGPKKKTREILWDLHRQWEACHAGLDGQMWSARKANQSRTLALSREWPWIFHPRERLAQLLQPLMEPKF